VLAAPLIAQPTTARCLNIALRLVQEAETHLKTGSWSGRGRETLSDGGAGRGRTAERHPAPHDYKYSARNHIADVLRGAGAAVNRVSDARAGFGGFARERIFPLVALDEQNDADNEEDDADDSFHNASSLRARAATGHQANSGPPRGNFRIAA